MSCWSGSGTAAWTPLVRSWRSRRVQGARGRGAGGVRPTGGKPAPAPVASPPGPENRQELLRHLLAQIDGGARPYEIRERLDLFYRHAARAAIPELTRLATTIETWWPAVEAFLQLRVTNARTEGYNTNIKLIKRTARGFAARPTTSVVSCSPTRQPPRDQPSRNRQIHASPRRARFQPYAALRTLDGGGLALFTTSTVFDAS